MLPSSNGWGRNRRYQLLTLVLLGGGFYRHRSLLARRQIQVCRLGSSSTTQPLLTTTRYNYNSNGDFHAAFRFWLPMLGHTRLIQARLVHLRFSLMPAYREPIRV